MADNSREVGGDQLREGIIGQSKKLSFHSKCDGKPLKGLSRKVIFLNVCIFKSSL